MSGNFLQRWFHQPRATESSHPSPSPDERATGTSRANLAVPRRHAVRLLSAVALVGLVSGCLSPTLPLPPPSRPDVTAPDASGLVTITGRVHSYSLVFAQNERTKKIVGQETGETGRYSLEMEAEVNDQISVWESYKTEESDSVIVVVPESNPVTGLGGAASE